MRLYLVQHGDAVPKEADAERPLSEIGREDVTRLAGLLGERGVHVERVAHSGKTRARETAEILAHALGPGAPIEPIEGLGPTDAVEPFLARLETWGEDVLVVAHMPFVARAVSRLVTGREDVATVAYRPGSLVRLERAEDGTWAIAWMLRPELLG